MAMTTAGNHGAITATSHTRGVLADLWPRLDGRLLLPGQDGYDRARTVWNAAVDRRPVAIVQCAGTFDVVAAVRAAREAGLEIGVRCGGHSMLGHAVPDHGLMLDLTAMGGVRVDVGSRRARVQGGALLGALDRASQVFGLATTAGNVSHTGVGGLTLGGGMGWLARQHGLACDNVVSFEVVLADGRIVRASADSHPDLYWGLRGGGGNFGVVTEFEFRLHPTGTQALVAEYTFDADQGAKVVRRWRDLNAEAPRQATFAAWVSGRSVTLGFVWVGDPDEGRRLLPAMRSLGRSSSSRVYETSYVQLQTRDDTVDGHAFRRYSKGHYLRELSDGAIDAFLGNGNDGDDGSGFAPNAGFQAYGGAIADVGEEDTAFSHRDTTFEWTAGARWTEPGEDDARIAGARAAAAALAPFASGVYSNMVGDEGEAGVRRAYSPAKLARLTAVKDAYDPDNVFHLNPNIRPSTVQSPR